MLEFNQNDKILCVLSESNEKWFEKLIFIRIQRKLRGNVTGFNKKCRKKLASLNEKRRENWQKYKRVRKNCLIQRNVAKKCDRIQQKMV